MGHSRIRKTPGYAVFCFFLRSMHALAEIKNHMLGCPSPPIALGDWLTGAKTKKIKRKKGPSPPIAIRRLAYRGNNSKNKKLKKKRKINKKKGPSPPIAV